MCLALGVERLDDAAAKLEAVLEMQPPQGLAEKVKGLKKLKSIADSMPKTVRSGAAQEIVLRGDDVDLELLPIQHCWPGDPAPFITLPAVITQDPKTGTRNVGMYRMQMLDSRSTAMHWQLHKDGRMDYLAADGRLDVVRRTRARPGDDLLRERAASEAHRRAHARGFLKGEPVELVKCKTNSTGSAGERGDRARGLRGAGRPRTWRARSATTRATTRRPSRSRSST